MTLSWSFIVIVRSRRAAVRAGIRARAASTVWSFLAGFGRFARLLGRTLHFESSGIFCHSIVAIFLEIVNSAGVEGGPGEGRGTRRGSGDQAGCRHRWRNGERCGGEATGHGRDLVA